MNDYFLQILIRQRQEEIMDEARIARLTQPEWLRIKNWMDHILRRFLPAGKTLDSNQPPILDERSST